MATAQALKAPPPGARHRIRIQPDPDRPGNRLLTVTDGHKQASVSVPMTATMHEKIQAVKQGPSPVNQLSETQALYFLSAKGGTTAPGLLRGVAVESDDGQG